MVERTAVREQHGWSGRGEERHWRQTVLGPVLRVTLQPPGPRSNNLSSRLIFLNCKQEGVIPSGRLWKLKKLYIAFLLCLTLIPIVIFYLLPLVTQAAQPPSP